jgi:hypothetical protein
MSVYTHDTDVFLGKDRTCVTTDMRELHTAVKQVTEKAERHGCKLYMDEIFNDLTKKRERKSTVVRQLDLTEWECHRALLPAQFLLVSCLTYPSTLKLYIPPKCS